MHISAPSPKYFRGRRLNEMPRAQKGLALKEAVNKKFAIARTRLPAREGDSLMTWVTVWSNDMGDTFAVGRLGARLNKLAK